MSTVEQYLRDQYARKGVSVSMESGMKAIFGGFELPSIYGPQKITLGPWNNPGAERDFTDDYLNSAKYRTYDSRLKLPVTAWFCINGEHTRELLCDFLARELNMYSTIVAMCKVPVFAYLEWAIRCTNRIDRINFDEALTNRPKTAAELLTPLKTSLLGMTLPSPLVKTIPFREDVLTTIRIPQRPDYGQSAMPMELNAELAKRLIWHATKLDQFADSIDDLFPELDRLVSCLRSFRELVRADEGEIHPLIRFLDREMQNPLNTEVFCALFGRARAIASFIKSQVWFATHD